MAVRLDELDRKILRELQRDASQSLDEIAKTVASSKTPVWNRIRKMREAGVIGHQTVLLDAEALGLEACFFVLIRTSEHEADWQRKFLAALKARPEVLEAHRLAGEIDYILKVRVRNARAYDEFYQALISEVQDLQRHRAALDGRDQGHDGAAGLIVRMQSASSGGRPP
jgi:Lrp/AsnC family transcriptional regulator